jgi:hypothetical protein
VNDTTEARIREGEVPATTSSENTTPVKLAAGARLVFLADERRIFIDVLPDMPIEIADRSMIRPGRSSARPGQSGE